MPSRAPRAAGRVAIVSNNAETLDGLQQYLCAAGVSCRSYSAVEDDELSQKLATIVILFPDDFPAAAVFAFLRRQRDSCPKSLTLLVTREPNRFREVAAPDGRSRPPIVLPKPAFGWAILEAIRANSRETHLS